MSLHKARHRGPLDERARGIRGRITVGLMVVIAIVLLLLVPRPAKALTLDDPGHWSPSAVLDTGQAVTGHPSLGRSMDAASDLLDRVRFKGVYVAAYATIGQWESEGFVPWTGGTITDSHGREFTSCYIREGDTSVIRCLGGFESTS